MNFNKIKNKDLFREAFEFAAIGNRGVQKAILESNRLRVATVFAVMDAIFYRMPDGTITTKSPYKKIVQKKKI